MRWDMFMGKTGQGSHALCCKPVYGTGVRMKTNRAVVSSKKPLIIRLLFRNSKLGLLLILLCLFLFCQSNDSFVGDYVSRQKQAHGNWRARKPYRFGQEIAGHRVRLSGQRD